MRYSEVLVRHFRRPKRGGTLPADAPGLGSARVGDALRGGVIGLQLRVDEATARIVDARFQAYGCGATIAAASWVCDWLPGRTAGEVEALRDDAISAALDLPPAKLHCAVLAASAARTALADYTAKRQVET